MALEVLLGWSLQSPVKLVEVCVSWPEHLRLSKRISHPFYFSLLIYGLFPIKNVCFEKNDQGYRNLFIPKKKPKIFLVIGFLKNIQLIQTFISLCHVKNSKG